MSVKTPYCRGELSRFLFFRVPANIGFLAARNALRREIYNTYYNISSAFGQQPPQRSIENVLKNPGEINEKSMKNQSKFDGKSVKINGKSMKNRSKINEKSIFSARNI